MVVYKNVYRHQEAFLILLSSGVDDTIQTNYNRILLTNPKIGQICTIKLLNKGIQFTLKLIESVCAHQTNLEKREKHKMDLE